MVTAGATPEGVGVVRLAMHPPPPQRPIQARRPAPPQNPQEARQARPTKTRPAVRVTARATTAASTAAEKATTGTGGAGITATTAARATADTAGTGGAGEDLRSPRQGISGRSVLRHENVGRSGD